MFEQFFSDPTSLVYGAATGLAFGFLLQKGGVTRYNTIVNQFRLKDFTVLKTMLTAIVVGAVGIYLMLQFGMIRGLHVKGAELAMNAGGGVIFGAGMVLLGYCPGTALAAIGQGSRDATIGVVGALVGAAAYAEVYPLVSRTLEPIGSLGKVTLADVAHVSPWVFIVALGAVAVALFVALEKWENGRARSST